VAYSQEIKNKAKSLATKGIPLSEISKDMGISERTLYNWCKNISADAIEEQIQTLSKRKPTEANTRKIAMLVNSLGKIKNMRTKKNRAPPLSLTQRCIRSKNGCSPMNMDYMDIKKDLSKMRVVLGCG
jgi:hypothetical protein